MTRVAILDDYQAAAATGGDWASLPDTEITCFHEHIADPTVLVESLRPFDVVVCMRERTALPRAVLAALPRLRLVVTTGMFNAVIDMDAADELGITVCGTTGTATPTPELTWALILALARQVPVEDAAVRAGGWQVGLGTELWGKTLGVVGLGHQGGHVARVGHAFGMRVIAWSQNMTGKRAASAGAELVSKAELFERSDVVTLHVVLSDRTRGLVGEDELRRMKPTAFLVNTSRGPIIAEDALLQALHEGWIAGAGLDVFDVEPLPLDHPLRRAPRTVLTPHLGYVTVENYGLWWSEVIEDIAAFQAGAPIRLAPRAPNAR